MDKKLGLAPIATVGAASALYCRLRPGEPGAWIGALIQFAEVFFVFFIVGGLLWSLADLTENKIKSNTAKGVILVAFLVLCWLTTIT